MSIILVGEYKDNTSGGIETQGKPCEKSDIAWVDDRIVERVRLKHPTV